MRNAENLLLKRRVFFGEQKYIAHAASYISEI